MRLHRVLVNETVSCLYKVFYENAYSDKVLEHCFQKNPRFGSRDRAYIAEHVYSLIRYKRLYEEMLIDMERKPVSDIYHMLGIWHLIHNQELPPWDEFLSIKKDKVLKHYESLKTHIRIFESWPDWIYDYAAQQLGDIWPKEAVALNQKADVVLRVNTLKNDRNALMNTLFEEGADIRKGNAPESLVLNQRMNVFALPSFKEGLFEVQDESSQLVSHMLDVVPGMRVIDACAGAGGKTLHIAALMQNKGQIIAMDLYGKKLDELKKRARRAGAFNIETREINSLKDIKRLENSADRLLLDVPCSGLGVVRRNPDTKYKMNESTFKELLSEQANILDLYCRMLKPNGKMVYATCSILPNENQNQVKQFLSNHPEFILEEENSIYVHESGNDGFYMARLARK